MKQLNEWRGVNCFSFGNSTKVIKPHYALERLEALRADCDRYITTEVGQHQMWAAQFLRFEEPNRWMTSGGLGTMGYGVPASIGVQIAHPEALVINVAGEASWLMNMQEMCTAIQEKLPVKQLILNNEYLGMVRQWQELLHDKRYSNSWGAGCRLRQLGGIRVPRIRVSDPGGLTTQIMEMLSSRPVIRTVRRQV